jgi:hypothetical protein
MSKRDRLHVSTHPLRLLRFLVTTPRIVDHLTPTERRVIGELRDLRRRQPAVAAWLDTCLATFLQDCQKGGGR